MSQAVIGLDSFVVKQVKNGGFSSQEEAQDAIMVALIEKDMDRRMRIGREQSRANL